MNENLASQTSGKDEKSSFGKTYFSSYDFNEPAFRYSSPSDVNKEHVMGPSMSACRGFPRR
jgi:hypothetical protein